MLLFYLPLDFGGHSSGAETILRLTAFLSLALIFLFYPISLNFKKIYFLCLAFLISLLFSTLKSFYFYGSLQQYINYAVYFLIFILVIVIFKKKEEIENLITWIFLIGSIVSLVGLFFYFLTNLSGFNSNFYATFYQTDVCAGFLLLILPLALSLFISADELAKTFLYALGALLIAWGLILTHSRGGILSFILILPFLLWSFKDLNKKMIFTKLIIFLFFLLIGLYSFNSKEYGHKSKPLKREIYSLVEGTDSSVLARLSFWSSALSISMDYPISGIGLDNFNRFYPRYIDNGKYFSKFVHNFYLQLASEGGWISLIFFLLFLFSIIRVSIKTLKYLNPKDLFFYKFWGIALGALALIFHIFVDVDWQFSSIPVFLFTYFGIICATGASFEIKDKEIKRKSWQIYTGYFLIIFLPLILLPYLAEKEALEGKRFEDQGAYQKALIFHERALKLNPLEVNYRKNLANLYDLFNRQGEALNQAQRLIKEDPKKAIHHQFLAQLYLKYKNEKYFLAEIRKAIELDPFYYPDFNNDLGAYYLSKRDFKKAEVYYKIAISLYPESFFKEMWNFRISSIKLKFSESFLGLGSIYANLKQDNLAEIYYLKALKYDKNNALAYLGLGIIYFNQKNYILAEKLFKETLKYNSDLKICNYYLNKIYQIKGKIE
ncbi:MAG: O-antigen ligase family protein [Armatimonadetes bacterium]|nr:O-antigen ligase family protein [Armatimonadota bacterium]